MYVHTIGKHATVGYVDGDTMVARCAQKFCTACVLDMDAITAATINLVHMQLSSCKYLLPCACAVALARLGAGLACPVGQVAVGVDTGNGRFAVPTDSASEEELQAKAHRVSGLVGTDAR